MLASRHIKREKRSLPVDVLPSKTSLLKLPNVSKYLLRRDIERRWLKGARRNTELVIFLFISRHVLATPPTYVFRIHLVFTEPSIVVGFKLPDGRGGKMSGPSASGFSVKK